MSGPIVRKYGFPNFEKIFGERPLEHGAEGDAQPEVEEKTPKSKSKATEKEVEKKPRAKKK